MTYEFVIEYSSGRAEQINIGAETKQAARSKLWVSLTDSQKNAVADIECVND